MTAFCLVGWRTVRVPRGAVRQSEWAAAASAATLAEVQVVQAAGMAAGMAVLAGTGREAAAPAARARR